MSLYLYVAGLVACLAVGWFGGFMTFKRSLLWCGLCGSDLNCPSCMGRQVYVGQAAKGWRR